MNKKIKFFCKLFVILIFSISIFYSVGVRSAGTYNKYDLTNAGGKYPNGSLISRGGIFYGLTYQGGANNRGTIFSYNPSAGSPYTKLYDFSLASGSYPYGSLVEYNNKLYGLTYSGGANDKGVIFSYDPSSSAYAKLYDLSNANGSNPFGSLSVYNNKLYGMTYNGGASSKGVIFSYDPSSGSPYAKLYDFNAEGYGPQGHLVLYNNKLYGVTYMGGIEDIGVIFSYDPSSGSPYTKLYDFNSADGGGYPSGSLIESGGVLYGLTSSWSLVDSFCGVIFSYNVGSSTYANLQNLDSTSGCSPKGSLVVNGNKLYGMTSDGGDDWSGAIFSYDLTSGSPFTKLYDFNATGGSYPRGSLLEYNGKFYGMTQYGGANSMGVVFEYTLPNAAPTASDVIITGTPNINQVLTGSYIYNDAEGDTENGTTFRWLRNDVEISGETSSTYTTTPADVGTFIKFEVTPAASSGVSPGSAYESGGTEIVAVIPIIKKHNTGSSGSYVSVATQFKAEQLSKLSLDTTTNTNNDTTGVNLLVSGKITPPSLDIKINPDTPDNLIVPGGVKTSSDQINPSTIEEGADQIVTIDENKETNPVTSPTNDTVKPKNNFINYILGNSIKGDGYSFIKDLSNDILYIINNTFSGVALFAGDISKKTAVAFNEPVGKIISKVVSTTGVITGLYFGITNVLFSNPLTLSEILFIPLRFWTIVLAALGIKKRNRPWGTVYDSVTKQPLDPVYVVLKDLKGKEVATSITDLDGRYGFLVPPGKYQISANKTNYAFPSNKLMGRNRDELYDELYFNEVIELQEGGVISRNIPMDSLKFDWNEFAKQDQKLMKFFSRKELFIARLTNFLFIIGFLISLIAVSVSPVTYNWIIFLVYIIMFLLNRTILKPKALGSIKHKEIDSPLSFAIMRIFSSVSNSEVSHKVTDKLGRYYCLISNGTYYTKIENKNIDESYSLVYTSDPIEVTNGYINKKFNI